MNAFDSAISTTASRVAEEPLRTLSRRGCWIAIPLVAAVYSAVASICLILAIPPGYASAIWPPAGIALAAWLAYGGRVWPGIFVGAALANLGVMGTTPATALAIGAGNALEAAAAALLCQRWVRLRYRFEDADSVWRFILIAAGASLIAATNGVLALTLSGAVPWSEFGRNWVTWWLGDATGIVIVTPLLLCWSEPGAGRPAADGRIERQLFGALLVLFAAFASAAGLFRENVQTLAYMMIPFVAWAASRLDQRAVTGTSFAISAVAVVDLLDGNAIMFSSLALNTSLLLVQVFVSAVAVSGLMLSARSLEMEAMRRRLTRSNEELARRLEKSAETLRRVRGELAAAARRATQARDEERQRLSAELHDGVAQDLSSVRVSLDLLRDLRLTAGDARRAELIEQASALVKRASASMREIMIGLRRHDADAQWLPGALRRYASAFEERTGVVVRVTSVPAAIRVSPQVRDAVVGICREALNNVHKHSDAGSVRVTLESQPSRLVVRIEDDGRGFDAAQAAARQGLSAFGLSMMRERALAVNGELRMDSGTGRGTRLEVALPV
jgi:signal transduction histidine kinase